MNFIKDESKAAWKYIWTFVKWLFIAGVTGIVLTKLDGTAKGGVVLAIAKEIVDRHQGSIALVDRPGPGLTLRIELPVEGPGHEQ